MTISRFFCFRLIYLALIGLLFSGCAIVEQSFKEPTIRLGSIQIMEPQGLNQRFKLTVLVQNPNPMRLPVQGLSYNLSLNGNKLINGVSNSIPTLKAYEETEIPLVASIDLLGALGFLNSLLNSPQAKPINYNLTANINLKGFGRAYTVRKTGVVDLSESGAFISR